MSSLPDEFSQLGPFVQDWAHASKTERQNKRFYSSMEELQTFYDAILPRIDEILAYLNRFTLEQMPQDARRLFYLSLSLAEVAPAVELFKQPRVPDGFDVTRIVHVEDRDDFRTAKP